MERYFRAQQCFGAPLPGEVDYTMVVDLDLGSVEPSLAGPKRPQDRVPLSELRVRFDEALRRPVNEGGYNVSPMQPMTAAGSGPRQPQNGDVVIAAITSCTNTSNPGVMLMAGLMAKKAVERGLKTKPWESRRR